jgi:hypothetical protein
MKRRESITLRRGSGKAGRDLAGAIVEISMLSRGLVALFRLFQNLGVRDQTGVIRPHSIVSRLMVPLR